MRGLEVNQSARGGRTHFRFRILRDQAVEFCLQSFPHAILEAGSLVSEPSIERGGDPVEIFEEALTIRLEDIVSIRGRIETRLKNGQRIDPTLLHINAHAFSTDFYEAWDLPIDAVDLRKCMPQTHFGLCVGRPIPQQLCYTVSRNGLALREA